jgi:asparagine synthase (glutamine-hydrolysing)
MQFGYVPSPRSIYIGLGKLPPGHLVKVGAGITEPLPRPYWRLGNETQLELAACLANANDAEVISRVHDQLHQSVGQQMVADVPLGAFLSGGIDSSLVVALMQTHSSCPVRTFTIGFAEEAFNEAPFAKAVATHLGTDHTELYVSASMASDIIPELPRIYDEPFADPSQIPTTLVSRLTRKHVTVSLSGDGGDELFAGYPRYELAAALWRRVDRLPTALRRYAARALRIPSARSWDRTLGLMTHSRQSQISGHRVHRLSRLLEAQSLGDMYVRLMSQWPPEERVVLGQPPEADFAMPWTARGTPIHQMRCWDVRQYLPDDLLVKVDRAAMSASLESRAPLLDHRVVELAFALPEHVLIRGMQGKWILRKVLDRYVPRRLIERPKTGFAIPLARWLRGPLRPWAEDLLDAARIRADGVLDANRLRAMWDQHLVGSFDRSTYLWNALMFQAWYAEATRQASSPPGDQLVPEPLSVASP